MGRLIGHPHLYRRRPSGIRRIQTNLLATSPAFQRRRAGRCLRRQHGRKVSFPEAPHQLAGMYSHRSYFLGAPPLPFFL